MELIRVSAGSASLLGLKSIQMLDKPTTIHLLQYSPDGCKANCGFCPQARDSITDKKMLSRVSWPAYEWEDVKKRLHSAYEKKLFRRICLQTVIYPYFVEDMLQVLKEITIVQDIPISVAITPVSTEILEKMKDAGVDRVGIALDGPTKEIFSNVKGKGAKGPFNWEGHWKALLRALEVFGKGLVSTHLIVGLGETERDILKIIQKLHDLSITVGLFAFTPIKNTALARREKPEVEHFRRIQLGRFLIINGMKKHDDFTFDDTSGRLVNWGMSDADAISIIRDKKGKMFQTSGCPGCNRPYYTSSPRGPVYNFASVLTPEQIQDAISVLFP
ncbi:MAG: radical SAM protein [Candidatus Hodarchaeota archaeon]